MDLAGIADRLTVNADKLGYLYGYLGQMNITAKRTGQKFLDALIKEHKDAIQTLDFEHAFDELQGSYFRKDITGSIPDVGIATAIVGWICKELDLPVIGAHGDALMKFGVSTLISLALAVFVMGLGSPATPIERGEDISIRAYNPMESIYAR